MPWESDRITIAGAGLAGSLAATLLVRRGWRVTVVERRPDPRSDRDAGGRSINLALANRGLAALRAAGLEEQVEPLLIPMRGRLTHARDGTTDFLPYGQRPDEVIYSISRAGLNRLLVDTAEATGQVRFRFERPVSGYDPAAGTLTVTNPDGVEHTFPSPPVVGADGAGSALRGAMRARGLVTVHEDILDHAYKELTIPPAPDGSHRIDAGALHIWPRGGFMLIALPNVDGSFTATLFLARDSDPGFSSLASPEAVTAFFRREFPDALDLIPDLEAEFFDHPTGMLGTVYTDPWHANGHGLLIGDAAHAIVPFHGQGMNAAFEDCRLLAEALAPGTAPGEVFKAFSAARKPDTDAIARMALENYVEMRDTVRDAGFALRKELGFELERLCPGRFVPRYSLVMFHHVPYRQAERRGAVQQAILERFTRGRARLADVDVDAAAAAVRERLEPLSPEAA